MVTEPKPKGKRMLMVAFYTECSYEIEMFILES